MKKQEQEVERNYQQDQELQNPSKQIKTDSSSMNQALQFSVVKTFNKARASLLTLPHGQVKTPVYMPVGTKAAIKGITYSQMQNLGCRLLLANTYHLAYKPGGDFLEKAGGIHKFVNWKYNVLTDSGGFQMVSLSELCEITEEGVKFESPFDKSIMFLRPEDSVHTQNQIGADILMALDDVVKTTTQGNRMSEACDRTIRWIDRNFQAHKRPTEQNLFPIIQGGLDYDLRKRCLDALIAKNAPGYAIGGLAGGETKTDFWKVVDFCTDYLPQDKPRYLMGVGYPVDLVICSCLGVDMFDCVFSTRTARFGTAFTKYGFIQLKNEKMGIDLDPIEVGCQCETCQKYSRAYLHNLIGQQETACHLVSIHNLHYLINLMLNLRQSIIDEKLEAFVKQEQQIPEWVIQALTKAGLKIEQIQK